jgi:16S rRNA (guanine966-N2)-methyltransferase
MGHRPDARRESVPDAGRVIAGTARSIRLEAPGEGTRPLGDRVKQTLFAIMEPDLRGATFLDLFAGSGAAGIEALSRGAAHATFVERDAGAIRIIKANLQRTGLAERATVTRGEVLAWLRDPARAAEPRRNIVLLDPPYEETGTLTDALDTLGPLLTPNARVVAKHFWRDAPPARVGLLASERERRFGETALTFYRRADDSTEDA